MSITGENGRGFARPKQAVASLLAALMIVLAPGVECYAAAGRIVRGRHGGYRAVRPPQVRVPRSPAKFALTSRIRLPAAALPKSSSRPAQARPEAGFLPGPGRSARQALQQGAERLSGGGAPRETLDAFYANAQTPAGDAVPAVGGGRTARPSGLASPSARASADAKAASKVSAAAFEKSKPLPLFQRPAFQMLGSALFGSALTAAVSRPDLAGVVGSLMLAAIGLPQIWTNYRQGSKATKDLSIGGILIWFMAASLFFTAAVIDAKSSWYIFLNGAGTAESLVVAAQILHYNRQAADLKWSALAAGAMAAVAGLSLTGALLPSAVWGTAAFAAAMLLLPAINWPQIVQNFRLFKAQGRNPDGLNPLFPLLVAGGGLLSLIASIHGGDIRWTVNNSLSLVMITAVLGQIFAPAAANPLLRPFVEAWERLLGLLGRLRGKAASSAQADSRAPPATAANLASGADPAVLQDLEVNFPEAVIFDYDSTLTDRGPEGISLPASDKIVADLSKLLAAGVPVGILTGRNFEFEPAADQGIPMSLRRFLIDRIEPRLRANLFFVGAMGGELVLFQEGGAPVSVLPSDWSDGERSVLEESVAAALGRIGAAPEEIKRLDSPGHNDVVFPKGEEARAREFGRALEEEFKARGFHYPVLQTHEWIYTGKYHKGHGIRTLFAAMWSKGLLKTPKGKGLVYVADDFKINPGRPAGGDAAAALAFPESRGISVGGPADQVLPANVSALGVKGSRGSLLVLEALLKGLSRARSSQ